MPTPATPSSTLTLSPLVERLAPYGAPIRTALNTLKARKDTTNWSAISALLSRIEAIEELLRTSSPALDSLSLSYADIGELVIGGEYGPGDISILTGPPDYEEIAWIGTHVDLSTVTVTSISAIGEWVTATAHGLEPGDRVYYSGSAGWDDRYWKVLTTPSTTTFTTTSNAGVTGSGGTIQKVFVGGHFEQLAVGGDLTDPLSAPVYCTAQGEVRIGRGGYVSLHNHLEDQVGYLGYDFDPVTKSITGWGAEPSGERNITIAGHGWLTGNVVEIVGSGVGNGVWVVRVKDANTLILLGSTVANAGAGGAAGRFFAGVHGQHLAAGGTNPYDANLMASEEGMFIRDVFIEINGLDGLGNPVLTNISPEEITIENIALDQKTSITDGGVTVSDIAAVWSVEVMPDTLQVSHVDGATTQRAIMDVYESAGTFGGRLLLAGDAGSYTIQLDGLTGTAYFGGLDLTSPLAITFGGTGAANASDARDNLGLGTMAVQDSTSVSISGGSISGLTTLSSADIESTGDIDCAGIYKVDNTQVLTNQQASVADTSYTPDATAVTYNLGRDNLLFNVASTLNNLLAKLRTHGIIAT